MLKEVYKILKMSPQNLKQSFASTDIKVLICIIRKRLYEFTTSMETVQKGKLYCLRKHKGQTEIS